MANIPNKKLEISTIISFGLFAVLSLVFTFFDPTQLFIGWEVWEPLVISDTKSIRLPDPFIESEYNFLSILKFILLYVFSFILGRLIADPLFKSFKKSESSVLLWFASFIFGYLGTVLLVRLLSLVFSHVQIVYAYYATVVLITILFRKKFKQALPPINKSEKKNLVLSLGLLFFFAVFGFQLAYHVATGHTNLYHNFFSDLLAWGRDAKFAILGVHYSEKLFAYLTSVAGEGLAPILGVWITFSFLRISGLFVVYLTFRRLNLSKMFSWFAAIFLFFGTTSLNPMKYYLLFDSYNPLGFLMSTGRLVSPIFALFLFVLFISGDLDLKKDRLSRVFTAIVLGLSFASTSFHNVLMLGLFLVIAVLVREIQMNNWKAKNLKASRYLLIPALLSLPLVLWDYQKLQNGVTSSVGYYILTAAVLCLVSLGVYLSQFKVVDIIRRSAGSSNTRWFLLFTGALVFSSLFLGNVLTNLVYKVTLPKGYPAEFNFVSEGLPLAFMHSGCDRWASHCDGPVHFMMYYGMIFLFSFIGIFWLSKAHNKNKNSLEDQRWLVVLLSSFTFLVFFLFNKDFMAWPMFPWYNSRWLELPVYFILLTFLYLVGKRGSKSLIQLTYIFGGIWIITPFVATGRPIQWIENLLFILRITS